MSRATLDAPAVRPLKRAIVGRPMASGELEETLLPKTLALPIFASDPLSSVAYATESALVVLVAASAGAAHLVFPISIAIAALLAIVVASYRQTVQAYETSGGAYIVAKDNLGTLPSLVGAAALLTDYVLTVAVSIAAGIFAVTSLAPSLEAHKVILSLGCLAIIVFVNLRGIRESGLAFALPTYAFVASMFALVGVGLAKSLLGQTPHAVRPRSSSKRCRRCDPVCAAARFLLGVDCADGRGSDRQRGQCIPASARQECCGDTRHPRRDCDHTLPRRLVSRGPGARPTEPDGLGRLADRPSHLPCGITCELPLLRGADNDAAHSRSGREHVLPGISSSRGAAGPGQLRAEAIHEPG